MDEILIKGGRVFCFKNQINGEELDILIREKKIEKIGKNLPGNNVIDARGMLVFPGFIDLHVHLREPGYENKETITTGSMASAKGGITTIVAMANTNPKIDTPEVYFDVINRISRKAIINVIQSANATKGMEGKEISEMGLLKNLGCYIFTDDGKPVSDPKVMHRVLTYAKNFDVLIFEHPEEPSLSENGVINQGKKSFELGLQGIPRSSESIAVARNILLAQDTEANIHLQHISTKESIELVRWAKKKGIKITCEVTPHHLVLTEDNILSHLDTNKKMNPPLRTEEDRLALIEALKDGTIDIIATDHAPHTKFEKSLTLQEAPFGTIGLETALPILYTYLIKENHISLLDLVRLFSYNPSRILKLENKGHISVGSDADITIYNPNNETIITEEFFVSKSKNSCFIGMKIAGEVKYTIYKGRIVYPFS
ncbi:MAG: dihydroorotase [Brevinematales bacterium]|nr:dihydroorotase [Brevinematales bacterium]